MKTCWPHLLLIGAALIANAQSAATPPIVIGEPRTEPDERLRQLMELAEQHVTGGTPTARATNAGPTVGPVLKNSSSDSLPGVKKVSSGRTGSRPPVRPASMSTAVPSAPAAIAGSKYCLREGDLIEVRVYQEEDLTSRVRLNKGGEVTLPLLGAVNLNGKGVEQARQQVQAMLEKDYLVNPQVTITVVEYAKRRFCVMGQVQQPGFYNIPENEQLNILQAISMAGGFTRLANSSRVTIKRNVNGEETVLVVNAQKMGTDRGAKLVEVLAEDTIIVSQRVF